MSIANRGDIDPDILARWIGISGLIGSASSLLGRRSGAWPRLALVACDTAVEAILGLMAANGPKPPAEKATFEQVYEGAILYLREHGADLAPGLGGRILECHRMRNAAIHHGSEPSSGAVNRAIVTATRLRDLAARESPLLSAFQASGPVRAVAGLVEIPKVADSLRMAADALDRGDLLEAAGNGAMALDRAFRLVRPPLRPSDPYGSRSYAFSPAGSQAPELAVELDEIAGRAEAVEAWVLALAVGLQPSELDGVLDVLGRPTSWNAVTIHRDPGINLDVATVENALLVAADVIFRLWLTDGLDRDDRYIR